MNKEYSKSVIEIKAKELLLPLKAGCPDNVWQELNYHLNEQTSAQNKWTFKPSLPKVLIVAGIVVVGVIGLIAWKFSDKIGSWSYNKASSTTMFQKPKPAPPVKKDIENVPPPKPVVTDTSHAIARPAIVKDSVSVSKNIPVVTNTVVSQNVAPLTLTSVQKNWRDSVLAVRRNARHRRDSLAMANRLKRDSMGRSSRRINRDSAAVAKSDTTW